MNRFHRTLLAGAAIMAAAMMMIPRTAAPPTEVGSLTRNPPKKKNTHLIGQNLSNTPSAPSRINRKNLTVISHPMESPYPAGATENEQWIADQIARLNRLSALDDSVSLSSILAELRNPLPEIRSAAYSAVRAFGSREPIPYLEQMRRETSDTADQQALTDTIEHLKLPTMVEALESISVAAQTENQDSR